MKFLITGGTGFIGKNLTKTLMSEKNNVTIFTRNPKKVTICKAISDFSKIKEDDFFDVIINLAGSPIDRRWTDFVKKDLINSRVDTTKKLYELISRLNKKPKLFINASAIGFYGNQESIALTENSAPNKECFTHKICNLWENEAKKIESFGINLCIIRLGVVLGKNGGIIKKLKLPFSLGLGGKLGNGLQMFSWIHIEDVIEGIKHLIKNNSSGIYNFTSPSPITNNEFTNAMAKTLKRPAIFTTPGFLLKIIFGEMAEELLLKGQKVIPKRLSNENFIFKFKDIEPALFSVMF